MSAIIVVGTGRCGSSLIAHMLHTMGVCMGHRFAPCDQANTGGYWEDLDFKDLHHAYLDGGIQTDEFCQTITELIALRQQQHTWWGFKDPRTAQVLPLYRRELLPEARYIWVQRDPRTSQWSMLQSFRKRHMARHPDPWMVWHTWHVRYEMLTQWLEGASVLRVQFESVLCEPAIAARRMARWVFGEQMPNAARLTLAATLVNPQEVQHAMGTATVSSHAVSTTPPEREEESVPDDRRAHA